MLIILRPIPSYTQQTLQTRQNSHRKDKPQTLNVRCQRTNLLLSSGTLTMFTRHPPTPG